MLYGIFCSLMFTVSTAAKLMCGYGMLQIAAMETQLANRDTHTAEIKQKLADSGKPSVVSFLAVSCRYCSDLRMSMTCTDEGVNRCSVNSQCCSTIANCAFRFYVPTKIKWLMSGLELHMCVVFAWANKRVLRMQRPNAFSWHPLHSSCSNPCMTQSLCCTLLSKTGRLQCMSEMP